MSPPSGGLGSGVAGGNGPMPPCAQAGRSGVLSLGPELLAEVPIDQFTLPVEIRVDLAAAASVGFAVLFDQVVSIS